MKKLLVTYNAIVVENGVHIKGETCTVIEVADKLAVQWLKSQRFDYGVANSVLERLLTATEQLRFRHYEKGSLKSIEEYKD